MSHIYSTFILALAFSLPVFSQVELECKNKCIVESVIYEGAKLGVTLKPNCGDKGAYVSDVIENTSADRSLLKINDLLLSINNIEIKHPAHFKRILAKYEAFQEVTIAFERKARVYTIQVILDAKSSRVLEEEVCCDSFNFKENISVYPNPVAKNLHVSFKKFPKGDFTIEIFNLNGIRFYSSKSKVSSADLIQKISVENLEEGVYVLKVIQNANTFSSLFAVKKQ